MSPEPAWLRVPPRLARSCRGVDILTTVAQTTRTKTDRSNQRLKSRLASRSLDNPDFWSFRGNAKRHHAHGLMQYPAMMVPQMVGALLGEIRRVFPATKRVADPFVGSGTVLTEAMLRGMDFYGRDVNPLAALLCRTKAGPFFPDAAKERAEEAVAAARKDRGSKIDVKFPGLDKWFTEDAQIQLSRIRRAIRKDQSRWVRRFLWVALAETVRQTSNSRTSTFKLHIRSSEDLRDRTVDPIGVFAAVVEANLERYQSLSDKLRKKNRTERGHYLGDVQIDLVDARSPVARNGTLYDVVVTSPPYGDNATTVPYGQYSYLPLQWIDLADIGDDVNVEFLRTTHEIDRRSLGGSRRVPSESLEGVLKASPALGRLLKRLQEEPPDRAGRVSAFIRDLGACLDTIDAMLKPGGVMVWVLGNRRVAGRIVPLDNILKELLASRNFVLVTTIKRRIPSKRMAHRNSVAKTMLSESILVIRKRAQ